MKAKIGILSAILTAIFALSPIVAFAQKDFNPHFIISDAELQNTSNWTSYDIQRFLDGKGSYLRTYQGPDASGTVKTAANIIYDASKKYEINPKFLLVTLQKEQSLITDDAPTQKQLDWATGFAVCDSCSMEDPSIQNHKGFGKQVDDAAGIMRWYYQNLDKSFVKQKDTPVRIDNQEVTPQSWATAFLYTYTPHLHGNANFWRIWDTWFEQVYPSGTLLKSASSSQYYLVQDGKIRLFKSKTALITRTDPKLAITIPDLDLANYATGTPIAFSNYSLLRAFSGATYLLDFDTLRPFESEAVVRQLGFNPDEVIDTEPGDLIGYQIGLPITASSTAPQGIVYQITDLNNAYYLLKDNLLYPVTDKQVIDINYKSLGVEKHKRKDLAKYEIAGVPVQYKDGTIIQVKGSSNRFVLENGKKRRIADDDTFAGLGYKRSNIVIVSQLTALSIPEGEQLFLNRSLLSSKNKFLGDSSVPAEDLYGSKVPSYLVAEYPSGRIIAGKDIDSRRSIASITKLISVYESLSQNYDLNAATVYSTKKYHIEKNPQGFKDGEKIKNKDLFAAALIISNNNATRAVAQGTGLSENELAEKANARLEAWGADNTSIVEPTGLSGENKSSARDLLKIFVKVMANDEMAKALGTDFYSFNASIKGKLMKHGFHNSNKLMFAKHPNYAILASKTGYTVEADSTMVMLVESTKTKQKYVIVTLGDPDYPNRFNEPGKIANWITSGSQKLASE